MYLYALQTMLWGVCGSKHLADAHKKGTLSLCALRVFAKEAVNYRQNHPETLNIYYE